MGKSLVSITDHPLINVSPLEVSRISRGFKYYRDDIPAVKVVNAYGVEVAREMKSLNLTHLSARKLASIIFNEQVQISVENETLDDYVNGVLDDNAFKLKYEEELEAAIAVGGFAIRPYVENNQIKLAWIRADQFFPLKSNTNEINSAVIVHKTTMSSGKKTKYYSLLEFHDYTDGVEMIVNELYVSEQANQIGEQVPLTVLDIYAYLPERAEITAVRPSFAYFKCPGKNNINIESPLGVGIVDNNRHTIDSINRTYDELHHEIKFGKRKVAISSDLVKPAGGYSTSSGMPAPHFDSDQDTYMMLNGQGGTEIKDLTPSIRIDEYQKTLDLFIQELESGVGLSRGTLSTEATKGATTATQVVSDNSDTYRTRSSYLTQVEKQIKELVISIVQIASNSDMFDGASPLTYDFKEPIVTNMHFDDGVFVDKDTQAKADSLAMQMGVMSKVTFMMRNYGLSREDALAELKHITDEQAVTSAVPKEQSAMLDDDDGVPEDNNE